MFCRHSELIFRQTFISCFPSITTKTLSEYFPKNVISGHPAAFVVIDVNVDDDDEDSDVAPVQPWFSVDERRTRYFVRT